jgi:hypothetical protein
MGYESFREWLTDNYSAAVELWEMLHKEMGMRRNSDIDYERQYFTEFALLLYRHNRIRV